ncbi:hypothetical protein [Rummeliibacillus stabekisii]|uniref:hypothetical protein n=1 Tax=Rummeliibacillus stabekisii TaxID=241244 RepID=UPI00370F76A6
MNMPKKIAGAKFFQNEMDFIKLFNQEYSGAKLTASCLSTYILFHYICDDFGRVREDELNLKYITDTHNLPYSSTNKGLHKLVEIGLIKEIVENGKYYFAINNYEYYNSPDYEGSMNYFILPKYLLESEILNLFIKARDVDGLIGLMDLLNSFYRKQSIEGGGSLTRVVSTWIKKMKKTTRNINDWIKRIATIFECDKKDGRYIKDSKYILKFKEAVFEEQNMDPKKQQLGAKIRKDVQHFFSKAKVDHSRKDVNDCYYALLNDVLDKIYEPFLEIPNGARTVKTVILNTMTTSFKELFSKEYEVFNIGGMFRKILRNSLKQEFDDLDIESKEYYRIWHAKYKKPLPAFYFK